MSISVHIKQLALGMVVPALELTSWPSRPLHSSVPTLYTTLKLVVSKRMVNDWSSNGDSASAINHAEDVDSVASPRGTVQLSDRYWCLGVLSSIALFV